MKSIRLLALFTAYVAVSLAIGSCKEPEANGEADMPKVTLSAGEATSNSLTFTVEPSDAQKCAWLYVEEGSELPDADQILSTGTQVSSQEASTVTVSELNPASGYVVLAAVAGKTGTLASDKLVMKTLEDSDQEEPEDLYEITFTDVVCDNRYADPGEFYIVMKDAKGEHDLKLDFFASKDAVALPAGTYKIGAGEEPSVLNKDLTFLNIKPVGSANTTVVMFSEGTVEVAKDGKKYTLDINLVAAEDGKVYRSRFEGEIKDMPAEPSETVEVTLSAASLHPNSEPENGYFLVKLNDDSWTHEMSLQFYSEAGAGVLPEGTYTFADTKAPGTVGTGCCLDIQNQGSNYFKSGTVVVTRSGENYKFATELVGRDDDRLFKVTFEGKIEGMETEQQKVIELVAEEASLYFNSNPENGIFYVKMNDKAWSFEMALDFNIKPGPASLPAGVYSVEDGSLSDKSYVQIYKDNVNHFFSSGTVEVSKEGDVYTMNMNLTSKTEPALLKITFEGEIKDMPSEPSEPENVYSVTMSVAKLHSNSEPENGYFLVKLNDDSWTHEMSLQFYSEAGAGVLPEGTYTFADTKTPGTVGTGSCLDIYTPYSSNYFKSGTVVVTRSGDTYKLATELVGRDDDRLFKVTFEGKIAEM